MTPDRPDSPFLSAHASALSRRLRKPPAGVERAGRAKVVPHGMSFEAWYSSRRRSEDIARAAADGMPLD